jgi:hypothetical protein
MANLEADAAESILKNAGSASREMAVASKVLGKTLGIAGVAYTAYNAYNQKGGFTAGDWVKVGIGAALIVNPIGWIGIGYAGLDILTEITTGTSITDRVGNGVNNMVKKW